MRYLLAAATLAALTACSPPGLTQSTPTPPPAPVAVNAPAGAYTLDKAHASLIFRVNHLSFSHFTGRFARWDAQLQLDPAHPTTASINVTIDPASIESDNPPPGFIDIMRGPEFLDAARFREMSFHSTQIELTGADSARITGDLTLHGVTRPVTLEATFNGGYPGMDLDPHARIGFSAHGALKRSDFGMGFAIPAPGSTMGVGDEVEIVIETEFSGPAWTPPATQP